MRFWLVIFFILRGACLSAQNTAEVSISGIVIEKTTGNPMPYANVMIKNNFMATVTNDNGEFKLTIPGLLESDSLKISFMGYKTATVAISGLSKNNTIFLEERSETLNEVQVKGQTAISIVKTAIGKIPLNYYTRPYKSKGFYRVTSMTGEKYVHLSEAVFELHNAKRASQFKLIKMRAVKDEKASLGLDAGLSPETIISIDLIPSQHLFLNDEGLKDYDFEFENTSSYMDHEVYIISFDHKKRVKSYGYKGKMFIDTDTHAIVYIAYGFSPNGFQFYHYGSITQRALMDVFNIHIDMLACNYEISYKKIGARYYLNTVYEDAVLTLRGNKRKGTSEIVAHADYIVNDVDFANTKPFSDNEILKGNSLVERQESSYDETFWDGYNIILPNMNFASIAKSIETSNKANSFEKR